MRLRLRGLAPRGGGDRTTRVVSLDPRAMAQRLAVFVAGLLLALVLLELALRASGALFEEDQDRRNRTARTGDQRVVLCVGESTTAMGGDDAYPGQLQEILRERTGEAFFVVNEGIPGGDSSALLSRLTHELDRYQPEVVVAMMGANDIPDGAVPHIDTAQGEPSGPTHALKIVEFALQLRHSARRSREEPAATAARTAGASYDDLVDRGAALARDYRHLEAEEFLVAATAHDPRRVEAFVELGRLYEDMSRPEEAQAQFVRGIEVCEAHGATPCDRILVDFARCLERRSQHTGAEEQFRLALVENELSVLAWFGLGRVLRKQHRFEDAATAFRRAIALDPADPQAHVSLGLCLESMGEEASAEEHLRRGWDMSPGDRRAFIRLADFYERHDEHDALIALGADALDVDPDDDIAGWMASYHGRRGDLARAEKYLAMADDIRRSSTPDMTRDNYHAMERILRDRGIQLVAVQYPVRSAEPLEKLFSGNDAVILVDNSEVFRAALQQHRFDELFWDRCYGDFGHGTRLGNRILADNIADAILSQHLALTEAPASDPPRPATEATLVSIPGGTFSMGALDHDTDARDWERPRHEVTISPFQLDRTEVTVAAFAEAVAAGVVSEPGCTPHDEWGDELCNYRHEDRRDHPVNGVSWADADAYCRWRGARLPTEAEHEFALRAGDRDAVYPWGDAPVPPEKVGNYAGESAPRTHAEGPVLSGYDDGFALTAPVASFPPNALGVHDLSGNIWEWCSDWFGPAYYEGSPTLDPGGPDRGERRVLKGGNFYCIREELRISERHHKRSADEAVYSGFRCAADGTD